MIFLLVKIPTFKIKSQRKDVSKINAFLFGDPPGFTFRSLLLDSIFEHLLIDDRRLYCVVKTTHLVKDKKKGYICTEVKRQNFQNSHCFLLSRTTSYPCKVRGDWFQTILLPMLFGQYPLKRC